MDLRFEKIKDQLDLEILYIFRDDPHRETHSMELDDIVSQLEENDIIVYKDCYVYDLLMSYETTFNVDTYYMDHGIELSKEEDLQDYIAG